MADPFDELRNLVEQSKKLRQEESKREADKTRQRQLAEATFRKHVEQLAPMVNNVLEEFVKVLGTYTVISWVTTQEHKKTTRQQKYTVNKLSLHPWGFAEASAALGAYFVKILPDDAGNVAKVEVGHNVRVEGWDGYGNSPRVDVTLNANFTRRELEQALVSAYRAE